MFKTKLFASIFLIAAVLFTQVGVAAAAPQTQDTAPISGTIQSITLDTDASGVTTVLVVIVDDTETEQTLRLSLEMAALLGLISSETDPVVDKTQEGNSIEVDPSNVILDEAVEEPDVHFISSLLADFFFDGDPEMAVLIDSFHTGDNEEGKVYGFGVIAQSLWMSSNLNDGTADATLAAAIMEAKQSGDYSAFFEEGEEVPANWGQFKKAVSEKKNNLGSIVSGHADKEDQPGYGQDKDNDNGNQNKNNEHGNKNKEKENNGKANGKNK